MIQSMPCVALWSALRCVVVYLRADERLLCVMRCVLARSEVWVSLLLGLGESALRFVWCQHQSYARTDL